MWYTVCVLGRCRGRQSPCYSARTCQDGPIPGKYHQFLFPNPVSSLTPLGTPVESDARGFTLAIWHHPHHQYPHLVLTRTCNTFLVLDYLILCKHMYATVIHTGVDSMYRQLYSLRAFPSTPVPMPVPEPPPLLQDQILLIPEEGISGVVGPWAIEPYHKLH